MTTTIDERQERCPGSDKWGEPVPDVMGKGRCRTCDKLVLCTNGGILFGHSPRVVAP